MMRKLLRNLALIAVAAVGVVSCTETDINDNLKIQGEGVTFTATTPSGVTTKIEFSENDDESISLEWEANDYFKLYDSEGVEIDKFTTKLGDGQFDSYKDDLILEVNAEYTAKYNTNVITATQDGDAITNLDEACQMEATFVYGSGEAIAFKHTMAIMTFKFESEARPAYLIFKNGDDEYKVTYTSIEPENGVYTSHIMIKPSGDGETSRTLTFSLYDSSGKAYDVREVETTKAYVAGCRYTSPVSDLENITWNGTGTEDDPYQITSAAQLRLLSDNVAAGTKYTGEYFKMTKDINLGGIDTDGNGIAGEEFTPIGELNAKFYGTFDGGGYKVSGLYINSSGNYQALFGYTYGATIKNLSVSGKITGGQYVGGVVGHANYSSLIESCYSDATVTGTSYIGGIIGNLQASIADSCYSDATVTGTSQFIGGIAGQGLGYTYNSTSSSITSCYNNGDITCTNSSSNNYLGGIVGHATLTKVISCYNTGEISGEYGYVGGIAGLLSDGSLTDGCYSVGEVSSSYSYDVGSIVGNNGGTATHNYYLKETYTKGVGSGTDTSSAMTLDYMQGEEFVSVLNNAAWAYNTSYPDANQVHAWKAVSGGYPTINYGVEPTYTNIYDIVLNEDGVYEISTAKALREFSNFVNIEGLNTIQGKLMNDIDLDGIDSDGNGIEDYVFAEIGTNSLNFEGTFDGCGYKISGLYINSAASGKGLFGYIKNATIKNLSVSGSVTGSGYTAGVVGYATSSSIISCNSNVTVKGIGPYVGGIVGYAISSSIISCYNNTAVTSTSYYVGGIAGYAASSSSIISCHNSGDVTTEYSSNNYLGGVVGSVNASNVVSCSNSGAVDGTYKYVGGVVGYLNNSSTALIIGCYNAGTVTSDSNYDVASILGDVSSSTTTSVLDSYYLEGTHTKGVYGTTYIDVTEMSEEEMKADSFVTTLNNAAWSYNTTYPDATQAYAWKASDDQGYPTPDHGVVPTYTNVGNLILNDEGVYEISTAAGWREFTELANTHGKNDICGKLTCSIDLGGIDNDGNGVEDNTFTPIGSSTLPYQGTFDGGGFEISGLYINLPTYTCRALFYSISGATIKNLGVSGSISGADYAAGLVAKASNSIITACYSDVTVTGAKQYVGGIVAYAGESNSITSCYNSGDISCTYSYTDSYVGGIAGYTDDSDIAACYNTGTIRAYNSSVGGIVGSVYYMSSVTGCYNVGEVSSDTTGAISLGSISGYDYNCKTNNSYYLADTCINGGVGNHGSTETDEGTTEMSESDMKTNSFVTTLNNVAAAYNSENPEATQACAWKAVADGYPIFDYAATPTSTTTTD